MVLDFGIVKRLVRDYIDQYIDHCLLVPVQYDGCELEDLGDQLGLVFELEDGLSIVHRSIKDAVSVISANEITTETVKAHLLEKLQALLPDNVSELALNLYTEPGLQESYQYSHGLRKHEGNCQRIAHGHRSQLEIEINDEQSEQWQTYWFNQWRDIYIGTSRHLVDEQYTDKQYHYFQYEAPQGNFFLQLPKERCYLIDEESTVENIAQHLAEQMAIKEPGQKVKIRAYEGIGKGAVAEVSN